MALPLILGAGALAVALLDRLSDLQDTTQDTVIKSDNVITRSVIPLSALFLAGLVVYQVLIKRKK